MSDERRSQDSVLVRLEEVASADYPFPLPERAKLDASQRIRLTSFRNLWSLLHSLGLFWLNAACPPLTFVFLAAGWCCAAHRPALLALAALCLFRSLADPFLIHFVTNGRRGGLGGGWKVGGATAAAGFFGNAKTEMNARVKRRLRRFVEYAPTPYLWSGDFLTMFPFLAFKGSTGGRVNYKRYWVKVPVAPAPDGDNGPSKRASTAGVGDGNGNEAVALDIVFPEGGYRAEKATFLVLHGLNGGSTEPYVLDLARRATKEGHTVAVMINRGLMKTPVRGSATFHGARTSDVGCAVDALCRALYGRSRFDATTATSDSKLILVGFSMGGIIGANYAAKSRDHSGLAGVLSFSGTLCSAGMLLDCPASRHSVAVWQPALAWGLKATIAKPSMHKFVRGGVTAADVEGARSVLDIDARLVCKYHGYATVRDYYADMSAGGAGDAAGLRRLAGTRVPLLAVHAIDDPIAIYEVALADEVAATDHVMLLATKHGGHIGWPTGMFPSKNRWNFMVDIAMEYADEVVG